MTEAESRELLPCPFCGDQPNRILGGMVRCAATVNGAHVPIVLTAKEWNTRSAAERPARTTEGFHDMAAALRNTPAEALREAGYLDRAADMIEQASSWRDAYSKLNESICQTLGKALSYPWFKDDQVNFPGATADNGVCVGDHVAESIADEAASTLAALRPSPQPSALVEAGANLKRLADWLETRCKENERGGSDRVRLEIKDVRRILAALSDDSTGGAG